MSKVKIKALTLTNSWLSENQRIKELKILQKLYIRKLERKWTLLIQNLWFLKKNWIYYELLKIKDQKNLEMNTLVKILKLTKKMISKSCNWDVNRNITARGFQRDQNCQISIHILRVIDPASQRPNSDWKWTVVGQTLNWGAKW